MYIRTLRESFAFKRLLEKIVQFGWFGTPINLSPFLFLELGIEHIKDYNSSWMKMISKDPCISKIVLMTKLFFQMFWQNISISFIIILESYSHLNESTTTFTKFLILFQMPLPIEVMLSKETLVGIGLMITFAIWVLKYVQA